MSTPIEEFGNPFADPVMSASPETSGANAGNDQTAANVEKSKGKKRVGFSGSEAKQESSSSRNSVSYDFVETTYSPFAASPSLTPLEASPSDILSGHRRQSSGDALLPSEDGKSHLPELSQLQTEQLRGAISRGLEIPKPRPAIRHSRRDDDAPDDLDHNEPRARSAREAHERGKRHEKEEQLTYSTPVSRQTSPNRSAKNSYTPPEDIQLQDFGSDHGLEDKAGLPRRTSHTEALRLVKRHTAVQTAVDDDGDELDENFPQPGLRSGYVTPIEEHRFAEDYQPKPQEYRGGILGSILNLYQSHGASRNHSNDHSTYSTPAGSPPSSGTTTPTGRRHWYSHKHGGQSSSSLATLVGSSSAFGSSAVSGLGEEVRRRLKQQEQAKRPGFGKRTRSGAIAAVKRLSRRANDDFRITEHIEETINRQQYLLKLCKALMKYGAPTHRLEEYMTMSARVLETQAQFLYIPGAMIVSFEDWQTHTSEVKLVKVTQGLDLGKLRDAHEVYKEVVHDNLSVKVALERLKELSKRDPKHRRLYRLPIYGLAAVCVGPFAFGARFLDLPIAFILGCILGALQLYVAPASDLYANVFEITAAVVTSFLARLFGSIQGGDLFCFPALAQSSIALILPGYTVLCASLELQSRSIVAGSVRMVYAIFYSLFLGYGITIGTAIYGIMDRNATSAKTCTNSIPEYWAFLFVPGFTMCLIIINQAKWKQAPVMMMISCVGYVVNFFSSKKFQGNAQVSSTLGALAIGVMANLYSRLGPMIENYCRGVWENKLRSHWKSFRRTVFGVHKRPSAKSMEEGAVAGDDESIFQPAARRVGYSLAAAAMLPAIFVQVPSGLAVNGSLVSGIASANQITGNDTSGMGSTVANITTLGTSAEGLNSIAFTVGYSVVQVAIGITVGLFLSAIVVYPYGKKRSGLFSF